MNYAEIIDFIRVPSVILLYKLNTIVTYRASRSLIEYSTNKNIERFNRYFRNIARKTRRNIPP